MKHLKPRQHYKDLYDRHTVEQGLRYEQQSEEALKDPKWPPGAAALYYSVLSYYFKGQRYADRDETIEEWMQKDRKMDEKFANTHPPRFVKCKFCLGEMELLDKMLDWKADSDLMRVIFYFRCKECRVGAKIDDLGNVEDIVPSRCPTCTRDLKVSHKKTKKKITTNRTCKFCGFNDVDVLELSDSNEKDEVPDPEVEKQYRKDKDRFCISDKEGLEYLDCRTRAERFKWFEEEKKAKKAEPPVENVNLPELEKRLVTGLAGSGFDKLAVGAPDMTRGVTVEFTVQDMKSRDAYTAKRNFKKLLNFVIGGTNWKLMSEGLNFALGIVSGRLRGK